MAKPFEATKSLLLKLFSTEELKSSSLKGIKGNQGMNSSNLELLYGKYFVNFPTFINILPVTRPSLSIMMDIQRAKHWYLEQRANKYVWKKFHRSKSKHCSSPHISISK